MKDWDCYAFMVFKQKKEHGMTISLFRVSLSANGGLHTPPPRSIPKKALPFFTNDFSFGRGRNRSQ